MAAKKGDKTVDLLLRNFPEPTKKALKMEAARVDQTMTAVAADMIKEGLIKKGKAL